MAEHRAWKVARDLGKRHSIIQPEDEEEINLRGSYIEKRFHAYNATGGEWYRGQLMTRIRGSGNYWMVSALVLFNFTRTKIFETLYVGELLEW
jgi:hypothetical protein